MENERRLIDSNKILKFCENGLNNPDREKAFGNDAIQIMAEIEFAPTVDAVEVVRCKDCRYFLPRDSGELNKCGNLRGMFAVRPDSYCSYGERRCE